MCIFHKWKCIKKREKEEERVRRDEDSLVKSYLYYISEANR